LSLSAVALATPAQAKPSCDGRAATIVVDDVDDLNRVGGYYEVRGTTKSDVIVIALARVDEHASVKVVLDGIKGSAGGDDAVCATTSTPGWLTTLHVAGGDYVSASGWEVFEASNPTTTPVTYSVEATRLDMQLGGGNDSVSATSRAGNCGCQQLVYIDAGAGNDWVYVNVLDNPKAAVAGVFGGTGDDNLILHGSRTDTIGVGGAGSDAILTSNATLLAYGGTPTYTGTAGGVKVRDQRTAVNALLKGTTQQLSDALGQNPASDKSPNQLFGGSAADILHGADGADTINGSGGNDKIRSYGGADTLVGSTGDDRIEGGNGNDSLNGGDGADWLRGNDDDDALEGGAGTDDCSGGAGTDVLKSCNP